jgi:adenylate cyclase class 2
MSASGATETEIKLRLESAGQGRRLLRRHGFRVVRRRVHEDNIAFDSPELGLRRRGLLLRLRRAGSRAILTFKGVAAPGKHKTRFEIETAVNDAGALEAILLGCGLHVAWHYEKYRTEYRAPDLAGLATLDETPIGVFLELEGPPAWIDRTAELLGFDETHYLTMTYGPLYEAYARPLGLDSREMIFR